MPFLEAEFGGTVRAHGLFTPGDRVVVGVSGGPDSVALLHLLARLSDRISLELLAVYVDHGLRPVETPAEADCVRGHADSLGLPCRVVRVDTPGLAQEEKLSLEHAARTLRYDALRSCAREFGAQSIAVAHTADDQVEEILLRLLRGSGRRGLSGMRMRERDIVRPLLAQPKARLLSWLDENGLRYCQDSSNRDSRFLRNRVRHRLLPLLEEEFDAGVRGSLLKSAANLAEDEDFLDGEVEKAWQKLVRLDDGDPPGCLLVRPGFVQLHPCLQRRLAERLFWALGSRARHAHILQVLEAAVQGRTGSEYHFSRGLRLGVEREILRFSWPVGKRAWRGRLGLTPSSF